MVQLKITALFSVFTALSSFVAAVPMPESAAVSAVEAASFDYKAAATAHTAKVKNVNTDGVYFDYTLSHPNGSTTAILRQQLVTQSPGYDPAPVWNSYAKVEFDSKNKIVNYEDRWFDAFPGSWIEPTNPNDVNTPAARYEKALAKLEKDLNATRVPIYNHGLRVYGYCAVALPEWDFFIVAGFNLKRKSDGAIISYYRPEWGHGPADDVVPTFLGERFNQWVV